MKTERDDVTGSSEDVHPEDRSKSRVALEGHGQTKGKKRGNVSVVVMADRRTRERELPEVRKVAYMNPTKNENGGDNKWI